MRSSFTAIIALSTVFAALAIATPAQARTNGISQLVAVQQMRANNANDEALEGADRQRELIERQRRAREAQRRFESMVRDADASSPVMICRACALQTAPLADDEDDEDDKD